MYKSDMSVGVYFSDPLEFTTIIVDWGRTNEYLYQLSKGETRFFGMVWAVRILTKDGKRTDMSRLFRSYKDALEYLEGVDSDVQTDK